MSLTTQAGHAALLDDEHNNEDNDDRKVNEQTSDEFLMKAEPLKKMRSVQAGTRCFSLVSYP